MHERSEATLSAKGRARREQIVEATFEMIATERGGPPTLRAIGRALEMETSHLLHYFSSRDALLQAVLVHWNQSFRSRDEGQSYLRRLPSTLRRNSEAPGVVRLYTELLVASGDPAHPMAGFFRTRFDQLHQVQTAEILQLQRRGVVPRHVDAVSVSMRVTSFSDGLQMRWLVIPELDMPAEMTSALLEWLCVPDVDHLQVDDALPAHTSPECITSTE